MKNVNVGQVCESFGGDYVVVTAVYPRRKTVDLAYTNGDRLTAHEGSPPSSFLDRPRGEIVDLGGRVIWNHE